MCKSGNKHVFSTLWSLGSTFQFSVFTENGNFQVFLKSFPQRFWSHGTHYQTLSDCTNSKG